MWTTGPGPGRLADEWMGEVSKALKLTVDVSPEDSALKFPTVL
jgi:hypothetical protein